MPKQRLGSLEGSFWVPIEVYFQVECCVKYVLARLQVMKR
jgi:hypothetical protein